MGARPNLHELLNFRCTRCSDRDARLGYFLLHINNVRRQKKLGGLTPVEFRERALREAA